MKFWEFGDADGWAVLLGNRCFGGWLCWVVVLFPSVSRKYGFGGRQDLLCVNSSVIRVLGNPLSGRFESPEWGYDPSCKQRYMVVLDSCFDTVIWIGSMINLPLMYMSFRTSSEIGTF